MQVLNKPTDHKLPFLKNNRRIKSLLVEKPNIYLESKSKKNIKHLEIPSQKVYEYMKGSEKSRSILREALTKHIAFDHIQATHAKFLSQSLIQSVLEPVKALNYNSEEFGIVSSMIKEIYGDDFKISNKEIISAKGQITKKYYVFYTSTYYRPFSFCCNQPIYTTISKASQVKDIMNPTRKAKILQSASNDENKIEFICSQCKKKVLRLKEFQPRQIFQSRKSNRSIEKLDEERQKINMTILIASGRYKKMRINESKDNLRYQERSMVEQANKEQKIRRIKSQMMEYHDVSNLMLGKRQRSIFLKRQNIS